jgi:acyl-homoserine-lactone acylase
MEAAETQWGSWKVKWGDVHRVRRGDYDLPIGGGSGRLGCFRVCDFTEADDGRLVMNGGDSFVFVVEFGDVPKAYSVLGYSQSGQVNSTHYDDQTPLFANNEMKTVAFSEEDIEARLIREYRPSE